MTIARFEVQMEKGDDILNVKLKLDPITIEIAFRRLSKIRKVPSLKKIHLNGIRATFGRSQPEYYAILTQGQLNLWYESWLHLQVNENQWESVLVKLSLPLCIPTRSSILWSGLWRTVKSCLTPSIK